MAQRKPTDHDHKACRDDIADMKAELSALKDEVMRKPLTKENTAKLLDWLLEGRAHGA